jgi:hypothetical protein
MWKVLFTAIAAGSITLAMLEVVAAPSTALSNGFRYVAPIATIHVAVPPGTKRFPADLIPQ